MSDARDSAKLGLADAEERFADMADVVHTSEHMRQRILPSRGGAYLFHAASYNAGMITTDDVRRALAIYGDRQIALAAATGVTQPTVSRWLKGAVPDPSAQEKLREILSGAGLAPARETSKDREPLSFGPTDLPVYAAVEGGPGELVVSTEAIDFVARPWYLGHVRDGYGVYVVGESMSPAYMPGDMAIVNPRAPQLLHKTYIFCAEPDDGTFTATIKKLVGQSPTHWKVEQHNPPRVFELAKADWPKAVRVVGKYEG